MTCARSYIKKSGTQGIPSALTVPGSAITLRPRYLHPKPKWVPSIRATSSPSLRFKPGLVLPSSGGTAYARRGRGLHN